MKRLLLDCTLRDGGYVNDWRFGQETIVDIFRRLVRAGIDVIEVGFLDERRPFDANRSIMPDSDSVNRIFGGLDRGKSLTVAMIDYGSCSLSKIRPEKDCWLDGIRVIFKKQMMREAFSFCAELKALGYKVFAQAISVTSYSERELAEFIGYANEIEPFAASMVDTYGLLHQTELLQIMSAMDGKLGKGIRLGYHAHNNFQMGYANSIAFLSRGAARDLIADGTLYGMGKSAGNAPLELLAMYMNGNFGKNYNVDAILEAIQSDVMKFYRSKPWGYNLFFYMAASNRVHPSYVGYLAEKQTLSVSEQNEILRRIDDSKKLLYDGKYIESLYSEYRSSRKGEPSSRGDSSGTARHKDARR